MTALQRRYFAPRSAPRANIIRVSAPRAAPKRRRGRARRAASAVGGLISSTSLDMAIGGLAYGFAVKSGWIAKLPSIPVVGRTGTAAILLGFAARRGVGGELVRKASVAAAVLAGYQLGSTGAITGDLSDVAGFDTMGDADVADGYEYAEEGA